MQFLSYEPLKVKSPCADMATNFDIAGILFHSLTSDVEING